MASSNRPNIVIFNTDQWRGDALGHTGNPAARTPHLDELVARDAVSFRNAFCQSPVCTPSRSSFMTGWYPHVRGHRTMNHMLHAERDETNLLRMLKDAGYFVWWGGKNHFVPGQFSVDGECDVRFKATDDDYLRWGHTPRPGLHQWDDWRGQRGSDTYYGFYAGRLDTGDDDIYCDKDWADLLGAVDFVRSYEGDQPFCLYLALFYPHPPYGVEEPWFSSIDREKVPPRAPTLEDWSGKPSILRGIWDKLNVQGWSEERWQELRATYYGMCARVDHQFGLLMSALTEAGIYDETAVFMFSDHGDFTGDYGLVEKTQNTFEDCLTNVPFILKPPRDVPVQPRVSDALIELVDFPATVFELTGVEPGYSHFGRSLLPVLSGDTDMHRDAVFSEGGRLRGEMHASERVSLTRWHGDPEDNLYWPRLRLQSSDEHPWHTKATMCRTATHKYVRRLYERDELYDLRDDPLESRNRIDDTEYGPVLLELKERMLTWYMETCDVVPFDLDEW
jgi:arylsulfatase A-like enzyme